MRGHACLLQEQDLGLCADVCVQDVEHHFDAPRKYADEPQRDVSLAAVLIGASMRSEVGVNSRFSV